MHVSDSIRRLALASLLTITAMGCSPGDGDSPSGGSDATADRPPIAIEGAEPPEGTPTRPITAENVLAHERAWPDIVALVAPWPPSDAAQPLTAGYRGALVRVEPEGRARIAFGRHGNHSIPLEYTDLVERANEVEAGTRHKIAPNFLLHFGTQFLHPELEALAPFPTPELAKSTRFLCIFAAFARDGFPALVERLKPLARSADVQVLFFPLDMPQGSAEIIKEQLTTLAWPVPFAYPQAAEVHAQKLVGRVPEVPTALLITDEGRLLLEVALDQSDAFERLQAATGME